MRGMKITVDAAMRARDVSRPRAEHEALARVAEEAGPKPPEAADPAPGGPPRPGLGRRRRRRH
jgi:hypothetical protein